MFGFLRAHLEKLLDKLLEPVWIKLLEWITRLSTTGRVIAALAVVAGVLIVANPSSTVGAVRGSGRALRVLTTPRTIIPLSKTDHRKLNNITVRMASSLLPDLARRGHPGAEGWSTGQHAAAAQGLTVFDEDSIAGYLREGLDRSCDCWAEVEGAPRNVVASSWALYGLAEMARPGTPRQVAFLLDNQSSQGWWSPFVAEEREEYASTYATSWAILALHDLFRRGLAPPQDSSRIVQAVQRGAYWLASHREDNTARWKTYPLGAKGVESYSLSGLAIHVLGFVGAETNDQVCRLWLETLPANPPLPTDHEGGEYWINSKDGRTADHFDQIVLPWELIATVDCYERGGLSERMATAGWIEKVLSMPVVESGETIAESWYRAELLLALRYLLDHSREKGAG
jgi:hypothetical protein